MGKKHDPNRPITRADWPELHPMPERHIRIKLDLAYDDAQMDSIRLGFKPTDMDEKWFLYFADDRLYFHRSWTGNLIFIVLFRLGNDGLWHTDEVIASRDPDYTSTPDEDEERRLIAELIDIFLLDPDYEYVNGFAAGLALAAQPNYLGSPQVVRDVLTPLFASKVGRWVHLRDEAMPAVTAQEVQDVQSRVMDIFAGENQEYTAMPWHSLEQLGQSLIAHFNLNAEYCADESYYFVVSEAIAAVSMAIHTLLKGYLEDGAASWPDAIRQLHQLQEFVESVLLGTTSLTHPGKTLRNFKWHSVLAEEEDDEEDEEMIDPHTHPCLDAKGKPVHIHHPHTASPEDTWDDPGAIATFVPGGDCPGEMNGIAFESWLDHPDNDDEWSEVEGQTEDLQEPPMKLKPGLKPASGCVIEEPDGRIWVVSPSNQFGGYKNTFPKGKEIDEVTWQANAIKEALEEAGLQVRITGFIGDVTRSTSVTRYYRAIRIGGMPVDMGWESQAVHLVPRDRLREFLGNHYDQQVLDRASNG